jgi:hypothetical protein
MDDGIIDTSSLIVKLCMEGEILRPVLRYLSADLSFYLDDFLVVWFDLPKTSPSVTKEQCVTRVVPG